MPALHKLVIFAAPELETSIRNATSSVNDWQVTIISSGPNTNTCLTDVEELTRLLSDVDTCIISTHTDFNGDRNLEIQQGQALGRACKKARVPHVICLGHLHCEKTIGIPARHYDSKAQIYTYIRQDLEIPATMVSVPPLYEMFLDFLCPINNKWQQYEIGEYAIHSSDNSPISGPHNLYYICLLLHCQFNEHCSAFPSVGAAPIDFIARQDVGYCLLPIVSSPQVFRSKTVGLCGEKLTGKAVTTILNRHLPQLQFVQRQVTVQEVRERPFLGAVDIANMFEFLSRGDLKASPNGNRELYPYIQNFSSWVEENKDQLLEAICRNEVDRTSVATVI